MLDGAAVAQLTVNQWVVGSNPTRAAKFMNKTLIITLILSLMIHVVVILLSPFYEHDYVVYKDQPQIIELNLHGNTNNQRAILAAQQSIFGEVLNICDQ